ncbi:MAG: glycine-rich domain-containing protein [Gammaproteobacteria bacterium]
MNESQQAFYDRISQYSFDEGDEELTFAGRLARENGWTPSYTARVIEEYKRFVFLAVVADHPVTPSDQVDQVWHLHLTYTHSYWDRFCGQVLGKPLHHGPTRGSSDEARKFDRWYQNTRESYARFFHHEPPTDIWPDASIRFGDDLHFQRINTKRNWVIAKPRLRGTAGKSVLLVLLVFASCTFALGIKGLLGGGEHSWIASARHGSQSLSAITIDL